MSLEEILRQKAEAKTAEMLRREQEQRIAAAETERAQKEEAEGARLLGLRQQVGNIDAKIGQAQSLLAELMRIHEQAGVSVAEAKKEGEELTKATIQLHNLFANQQFREILAEEGIESLDDLLKAEEYAEQEEVKSVKGLKESRVKKRQEAREQIRARGNIKSEAHKTITEEVPDVPRKRTYRDIAAALEDRVRELEAERKTVFSQTPEGEEALEKELFDSIAKRHGRYYHSRLSKEEIHNQHTVEKDDIDDAKEYGEEKVKTVIKEYYGEVIDGDLAEDEKRKGSSQLREAVELVKNLPKRWQAVRETLRRVEWERRETVSRLAELLENDRNAPLFQTLNNYGRYGLNDPQKLAEVFIDHYAGRNSMIFFGAMASGIPEAIAERIISEQENLLKHVEGGMREAFPRSFNAESQRYETSLYNPDALAIILAEQAEFYQKFQAVLTTPEEVFDKMKGGMYGIEISVRSRHDLKLDEAKSFMEFDGKTYAALRDTPLSQIKYNLEQQQKQREKTATALKEQIGDKVEANWASKEMSLFKQENHEIVNESERVIRHREIAENISSRLDIAANELKEYRDQPVYFTENGALKFDAASEKDLLRLYKEVDLAQKEVEKIKKDISLIDDRARWEKDGLFGGKKKKREKEKADLKVKEKTAHERLKNAEAEYDPKRKMDEKIGAVRSLIHNAERQEIALVPPRNYSGSLKELIDGIKKQMNFRLTPEQSQIYEQYQALKKKQEQTEKQYEKWRR